MSGSKLLERGAVGDVVSAGGGGSAPSLDGSRPQSAQASSTQLPGAIIGVLIGFQDEGRTPLVIFPGQLTDGAVPARSTKDVHGAHIGREVALLFEGSDARRPIIIACLQKADDSPLAGSLGQVEIEADGSRMIVSAKEQLVLRCGKASITLTKAGKVLLQGTYVSHRSSGVMRIKGGSVQLN
jgi:hypothetical protein